MLELLKILLEKNKKITIGSYGRINTLTPI